VINAGREDSCIGFVQVGAVNKLIPAYLAPSIRDALGSISMSIILLQRWKGALITSIPGC